MPHSLPSISIRNDRFSADILLQGAQLMHFQPVGQTPWIFQNAQTPFTPGREIYAGVPIIFPWFGRLQEHPEAPNHGFARQAQWRLEHQSDDESQVSLVLSSQDVRDQGIDYSQWIGEFEFSARMTFTFGQTLRLAFVVEALSPLSFECAFHPYFAVSDVKEVVVEGISDGGRLDDENGKRVPGGAFAFPPYGAFRFPGSDDPVVIREPERSFRMTGGSGIVIWNPGEAMEDLSDTDWPHFICVEPGRVRDGKVSYLDVDDSFGIDVTIELN